MFDKIDKVFSKNTTLKNFFSAPTRSSKTDKWELDNQNLAIR